MNYIKLSEAVLFQQLSDLVKEYEGLWGAAINLPALRMQTATKFELENQKLTPRILIGRMKDYLSGSDKQSHEKKVTKILDYLFFNGAAVETMCKNYKEAQPFLAALRQIMHFFVALFTRKPLREVVQQSEARIFISKARNKCLEVSKAALTQGAPTLRINR